MHGSSVIPLARRGWGLLLSPWTLLLRAPVCSVVESVLWFGLRKSAVTDEPV